MSVEALAIRRAVAATRRLCPEVELGNMAAHCITQNASIRIVKSILFDVLTEAAAARPSHTDFRRAPFAAVIRADRRALS